VVASAQATQGSRVTTPASKQPAGDRGGFFGGGVGARKQSSPAPAPAPAPAPTKAARAAQREPGGPKLGSFFGTSQPAVNLNLGKEEDKQAGPDGKKKQEVSKAVPPTAKKAPAASSASGGLFGGKGTAEAARPIAAKSTVKKSPTKVTTSVPAATEASSASEGRLALGGGLFGALGVGGSTAPGKANKVDEETKPAVTTKQAPAPAPAPVPAPAKKVASASGGGGAGFGFGGIGSSAVSAPTAPAVAKKLSPVATKPPPSTPASMPASIPAPAPAPAPAPDLSPEKVASRERWERNVKTAVDRVESVKAAAISSIGGSLLYAPFSIVLALVSSGGLTGQWEFNTDMLAIQLAVFGITYRYATRNDKNENLADGVLMAFVLTRALGNVHVPEFCSALPLNCGPPYGYLSSSMVGDIGRNLLDSYVAYTAAKYCLDKAQNSGLLSRYDR
jgi:hypothetical protein